VGNAIKYGRPGEAPRIYVSAERQHDEWAFAMRDNGAGFPPEQATQVLACLNGCMAASIRHWHRIGNLPAHR